MKVPKLNPFGEVQGGEKKKENETEVNKEDEKKVEIELTEIEDM